MKQRLKGQLVILYKYLSMCNVRSNIFLVLQEQIGMSPVGQVSS